MTSSNNTANAGKALASFAIMLTQRLLVTAVALVVVVAATESLVHGADVELIIFVVIGDDD